MTTKEQILLLFENNRGKYFSGEQIAEDLSVSRTAVWKAVKALQNDGYPVAAATNKGYCLPEYTDILSAQGIEKYLPGGSFEGSFDEIRVTSGENAASADTSPASPPGSSITGNTGSLKIEVFQTVSSTNSLARDRAAAGCTDELVIVSNEQTAGRGRLGRSVFTPGGTALYISLLLRPKDFTAGQATRITTMAAVAMCRAIEAVSEEKALIKWVNDIFLQGRKVCGILTEGSFNMETGMLDYAVLGLGVNVYPPENGFPKEIENTAGTVFKERKNDAKNKLCAEFIKHFFEIYKNTDTTDYVDEYIRRSFVIGKEVSVLCAGETRTALVTGIDRDCRLMVKYPDGQSDVFNSGEISLRL